ncbi:HAD family hydrolase [Haematobacter genomosp. 1]|uniref:Haloacid dehalogenase n=1 Tax=Haematobacter genomosp. 1 TaxID=366618 RepID=A0A212ACL6_9RHOB|nr:HAD family phosphatase [Haematobacter genomosp. 1]OWJ78749.1 haloacid dehalogenase [Haematobacter genomosp. 1]
MTAAAASLPKAVVFDIGNVLIEWQPERFFDGVMPAADRARMFAEIDLHAMNDGIDRGESFQDAVYATADRHPAWGAQIRLWHDRWLDIARPEIPGSVHLLRALRRKGIPVFALTNFGVETFALARKAYPFLDEFDRRYVSGELKVIKPDPQIYAILEQDSGVAPGDLLFTDDRIDNIAAASARGWRTHHFDGPEGWARRLVREGLLTEEEAQP